MKFDYVIGNPPYQDDVQNKGDRPNPVYDKFMNATYEIADCVEMIHPARFLFNAGQTSKQWNKKMLNDIHFKVLHYESDASVIFPNTDIKGGVAITLRNSKENFGAIETFTSFPELNQILKKIKHYDGNSTFLDTVVSSRGLYRFSPKFYEDFPDSYSLVGSGTGNMIVSNIFDKLTDVFLNDRPCEEYVAILGRSNNSRVIKYIKRSYIISNDYLDKYNVMLPEANGTGRFGETLSSPFVSPPNQGATDTFISIGMFDSYEQADNLLKYIKTKFLRALLGVNKATHHNPKSVWISVPLQDFTNKSDIDWSQSIADIDLQLYKKYGISQKEIDFIETHVKEMS